MTSKEILEKRTSTNYWFFECKKLCDKYHTEDCAVMQREKRRYMTIPDYGALAEGFIGYIPLDCLVNEWYKEKEND